MRTGHRGPLLAIAVVLALVIASPAAAIQYGQPDKGAHPYVGGLVYEVDGSQFVGCSGTMISTTLFLTAAHCAPDEEFQLVGVTFDEQFVPGTSAVILLKNGDFTANPDYDGSSETDIAVVELPADAYTGAVAVLPDIGVLDTLAPQAKPGKQARTLTAVGYGTTGLNRGQGGPPEFDYPDIKMRAEDRIIGLSPFLVKTTAGPGTGGGTCYGDSGGPFFLSGTQTIVAITITGSNPNCGGNDINLRLDTVSAQEFLSAQGALISAPKAKADKARNGKHRRGSRG